MSDATSLNAQSGKTRDVASEITKETPSSQSPAESSHVALRFDLVDPDVIRRLALRKTVGALKYGSIQAQQGLADPVYVRDRLNHLFEHLLAYLSGDKSDDHLGAMLWSLDFLCKVQREVPHVLKDVLGLSYIYGKEATEWHRKEMELRSRSNIKTNDDKDGPLKKA